MWELYSPLSCSCSLHGRSSAHIIPLFIKSQLSLGTLWECSFTFKIFVDFYLHPPWISQKTRNGVAKGRPWVQHHNCSAGAGAGLKPTNKNVPFYHHQAAERLCAQQSQAAVRDWNQKNARLSSMLHRQIICICTTPQHHNNTTAISRLPPQAQSYPAFCLQHKLVPTSMVFIHALSHVKGKICQKNWDSSGR